MNKNPDSVGYMIVRVTTARGAIPLEGATVTVSDYFPEDVKERGNAIYTLTTNSSGLTDKFSLPAPPRELSPYPTSVKRKNSASQKRIATCNLPRYRCGFTYSQHADFRNERLFG